MLRHVGARWERPKRGDLSRPTVQDVYAYRAAVDDRMMQLIDTLDAPQWSEAYDRIVLGLHHEFHFSSVQDHTATVSSAYEVLDQPGRREGFVVHNVLASYIHIHMGSKASLAPRFVATCAHSR